jgi:hypothetical protein
MAILILLAITVISAVICYYAAKRRGLNEPYWVFMGVLFGPLAVPFVFLVKPKQNNCAH